MDITQPGSKIEADGTFWLWNPFQWQTTAWIKRAANGFLKHCLFIAGRDPVAAFLQNREPDDITKLLSPILHATFIWDLYWQHSPSQSNILFFAGTQHESITLHEQWMENYFWRIFHTFEIYFCSSRKVFGSVELCSWPYTDAEVSYRIHQDFVDSMCTASSVQRSLKLHS